MILFSSFYGTGRQQDNDYDYGDTDGNGGSSSSNYSYYIGGYPRKGEIDYDLLTKLIMVLARGTGSSSGSDNSAVTAAGERLRAIYYAF